MSRPVLTDEDEKRILVLLENDESDTGLIDDEEDDFYDNERDEICRL